MTDILLTGGRVIDPAQDLDRNADVLIENGTVVDIDPDLEGKDVQTVLNVEGLVVSPGFVDLHTHLREPGGENKETIASGAAAAVAGGFTSIAAMPNTQPPIDNEASAEYVVLQAKRRRLAKVYPIGAVTEGRNGETLAELGQVAGGGAVAFSDDGRPVENDNIMRQSLEYAQMLDRPIINHAEVLSLTGEGVMNESHTSTQLGLPGIPDVSEEIMVHRDVTLAECTGGHVHIAHVSTAGSVDIIRNARERGVHVTAEVTPHHLSLTDERVETFDSVYKMKPPLRTQEDVEALRKGLSDGTIDCIATDHAPHTAEEKSTDFSLAPFGVIGLESALPVALRELVDRDLLDLPGLVSVLSTKPARILDLEEGTLEPGSPADITVFDPEQQWEIDPSEFLSKSENCPFRGWSVRGRVKHVFVDGRQVYGGGELLENQPSGAGG